MSHGKCLLESLAANQVMPSFLDLVSVFGDKPDKGDQTLSGRSRRFKGVSATKCGMQRTSSSSQS